MSCKLGKINPHLVKSYCLPSMFCYFSNTLYITQMAASIIKARFEPISVAVHFSTGHVGRESFNFLKISFPWELLNFEVNVGNIGIPWTWKAQEKKHRMSNQTNLVVTQYCHARKYPEKNFHHQCPISDWLIWAVAPVCARQVWAGASCYWNNTFSSLLWGFKFNAKLVSQTF